MTLPQPVPQPYISLSCSDATLTLSVPKEIFPHTRAKITFDEVNLDIILEAAPTGVHLRAESHRMLYTTSSAGKLAIWPRHRRIRVEPPYLSWDATSLSVHCKPAIEAGPWHKKSAAKPAKKLRSQPTAAPPVDAADLDTANLLFKAYNRGFRFQLPEGELLSLALSLAKRGFLLEHDE